MFQRINELVSLLWNEDDKNKSRDLAISLANEILIVLGAPKTKIKSIEQIYNDAYPSSYFNNQKVETWFTIHPHFNGPTALKLYDDKSSAFESSFFHLSENATKARIAATTLLGINWEDLEIYELPKYKVGIDFFLNYDSNSLLMVVSKRGSVRVVEFSERITKTQIEILTKLSQSNGVLSFSGLDIKTGQPIPREPQKTIHEILWRELQVNEVNKKFYIRIADNFDQLSKYLKDTNQVPSIKDSQLFSSRLIGRLLFLWFLKKMGLINNELRYFELDGMNASDYYDLKLKHLFFEVLNTQIINRKSKDIETPFLNGGLFETHHNDYYDKKINFPDNFFENFYNHLNSFNFTVDESTIEYEQVAIDPEMLGRVFENLLASIVPETSSSANERKNKGAFYTPREIVSYMCRETLKEYLKSKLNDDSLNDGLIKLIDFNDARFLELKSTGLANIWGIRSKDVVLRVIDYLNSIKIFDPACGSGAFPIGMLQLISRTFDRLNAKYDSKTKRHILNSGKYDYDRYNSKLSIIRNNLYGSDIEPMAIEITRLRAWLTIIIEEKNSINIKPLPNLDFNFVCSNTLLELAEKEVSLDFQTEENFEKQLSEFRDNYYGAHSKLDKLKLRDQFSRIYKEKINENLATKRLNQLKSWNPFDYSAPSLFFDPKLMFNVNQFDVVIANPPYIGEKKNRDTFLAIKDSLIYKKYYLGKMDFYYFFFHLAIELLSPNGILTFITTNYYTTADGAKLLRKHFFSSTSLIKLINFNEYTVFESAKGQHDMITILKKGIVKNHKTEQIVFTSDVYSNLSDFNEIIYRLSKKSTWQDKSNLYDSLKEENYYIRFANENKAIDTLLRKLGKYSRLTNYARVNQGIISGADKFTNSHIKKYPKIYAKKGDGIFVHKRGKLEIFDLNPNLIKPFYKNSDIGKWFVKNEYKYEIFYPNNKYKISKAFHEYIMKFKTLLESRREFENGSRPFYELHWGRDQDIFESTKIIAPQRSKTNIFAINNGSFYGSADIYFITSKENIKFKPYFLLGVLNSKLVLFWLKNKGKKKGEMLELLRTPLLEIPIPEVSTVLENKISDLVLELVNSKKTNLENEINNLVYEAYNLSNEEISLIENFIK